MATVPVAVTSSTAKTAAEHACALLTAYCASEEDDDEDLGEFFFELLDELIDGDRAVLGDAMIAMCATQRALVRNLCSPDMDEFQILQLIAASMHGRLS